MANGNDKKNPIAGGVDTVKELAKTIAGAKALEGVMNTLKSTTESLVEPFASAADAGTKFAAAIGDASGGFKDFTTAATQVDTLRAEIERATGASEQFTGMAIETQGALSGLGISLSEAKDSVVTLFNGFSEFTLLAPKAQKEIAKQAASMTRLGIAASQTSAAYNTLMKGMGMTQKEATKTNREMAKLAKAIGVAPNKMSKDFTQNAKDLARYGKGGIQVFKELAVQSKATGLQMSTLISIANKFDTFDSAATAAGNLNAMLGGNLVNSVDMLTASESERIDMIRNAMAATGRSWSSLDKFETKAIAGAVGITDMTDAMRLFGTEQATLDDLKDKADPAMVAQQNLTKAMQAGTKIAEKWAAAFERISLIVGRALQPVLRELTDFITGREGFGQIRGIFTWIADGIKKVHKWWKALSPEMKGTVKHIAVMAIKAVALGAAMKGVMGVASPLMDLLSSPWLLAITGIVAFATHLDDIDGLMRKVGEKFEDLDIKIRGWMQANRSNPFVASLETAYYYLRTQIPNAMRSLQEYFKSGSFSKDAEGAWAGLKIAGKTVWKLFKDVGKEVKKLWASMDLKPGEPFDIMGMLKGFWKDLKGKFNEIMRFFSLMKIGALEAMQLTTLENKKLAGYQAGEVRERMKMGGYGGIDTEKFMRLQNLAIGARKQGIGLGETRFDSDIRHWAGIGIEDSEKSSTQKAFHKQLRMFMAYSTGKKPGEHLGGDNELLRWYASQARRDDIWGGKGAGSLFGGAAGRQELLYGGTKATGGPIPMATGGPILVGEYGPERIVASGGGLFVEPHSAVGNDGGKPILVSMNIDGKKFAEAMYNHNKEQIEENEGLSNIGWG